MEPKAEIQIIAYSGPSSLGLFERKGRIHPSFSKSTESKQLARQGIEQILSPKQTRRPLPCLLILSSFYGVLAPPFSCCLFIYHSVYVFHSESLFFNIPVRLYEWLSSCSVMELKPAENVSYEFFASLEAKQKCENRSENSYFEN